jgi:hypothetical protein
VLCVFRYNARHTGEAVRDHLSGYAGRLVCDAATIYDALFATPGGPTEVACWSHARHYVVEAAWTEPAIAEEGLAHIEKIFEADRATATLPMPERTQARAERARPALQALQDWMQTYQDRAAPKTLLGKAMTYLRNQWTALTRFLEDGEIPLTSRVGDRRGDCRIGELLFPAAFARCRCLNPSLAPFPVPATSNRTGGCRDRFQVRAPVGGALPQPPFRLRSGFRVPPWAAFHEASLRSRTVEFLESGSGLGSAHHFSERAFPRGPKLLHWHAIRPGSQRFAPAPSPRKPKPHVPSSVSGCACMSVATEYPEPLCPLGA